MLRSICFGLLFSSQPDEIKAAFHRELRKEILVLTE